MTKTKLKNATASLKQRDGREAARAGRHYWRAAGFHQRSEAALRILLKDFDHYCQPPLPKRPTSDLKEERRADRIYSAPDILRTTRNDFLSGKIDLATYNDFLSGFKDFGFLLLRKTNKPVWPNTDVLQQITANGMTLIALERKNPRPTWKSFVLLDQRISSLVLVKRITNLIRRANDRLEEAGESVLTVLYRAASRGVPASLRFIHDLDVLKRGGEEARAIEWAIHKDLLSRFSKSGTVTMKGKISSAPEEVRCYNRV